MSTTPSSESQGRTVDRMASERLIDRRWSLVLFLAALVGIAQFGLGQFSPWVIAAPFVALLLCDVEAAMQGKTGSGDMNTKEKECFERARP